MSRNDATIDLSPIMVKSGMDDSKLLDNSAAVRMISPMVGKAATDKKKAPPPKGVKAMKVVSHSSDSEESSQI